MRRRRSSTREHLKQQQSERRTSCQRPKCNVVGKNGSCEQKISTWPSAGHVIAADSPKLDQRRQGSAPELITCGRPDPPPQQGSASTSSTLLEASVNFIPQGRAEQQPACTLDRLIGSMLLTVRCIPSLEHPSTSRLPEIQARIRRGVEINSWLAVIPLVRPAQAAKPSTPPQPPRQKIKIRTVI